MAGTVEESRHGERVTAPPTVERARELLAEHPRRRAHPSPTTWSDEVLYMLLPDRFSDGREDERPPLVDRSAAQLDGPARQAWSASGWSRFQGGTLQGVISKLGYLAELGVTAIWLGPPWKQRLWSDDYHGYAIQHFLDVDPRFGTRQDLVDLVQQAHEHGLRVIFDVVVNHTAMNWVYDTPGHVDPTFTPTPGLLPPYRTWPVDAWYDRKGDLIPVAAPLVSADDGVWPAGPLQDPAAYHRAGDGRFDVGDERSAFAELRVSDVFNRDLALTDGPLGPAVLETVIQAWSYWLELTDCDGFRIDTFKHFRVEEGRVFCAAIKERAELLGKDNFLLVAEVGGGDALSEGYLTADASCLSAVLEIGELKGTLRDVAGGWARPDAFFGAWSTPPPLTPSETSETVPSSGDAWIPGSHRDLGSTFVYCLDDHDNVWQTQQRFASIHPGLSVPAIAILVWTLGIPCLYFGIEQELSLPDSLTPELFVDGTQNRDRYLREAMFGPEHPRRSGLAGLPGPDDLDPDLPGFGPYGTSGQHVFDSDYPLYLQVSAMLQVRKTLPALRRGRQYQRPVRFAGGGFALPDAGGLAAWSRILADQEVVCVANLSTTDTRTVDVLVDGALSAGPTLGVRLATDRLGGPATTVALSSDPDGTRFVSALAVPPATAMVLA